MPENKLTYHLLEEQPLRDGTGGNISFGHDTIIQTLEEMVSTCLTPFTIGLFGKWGTGKSTIAEQLKTSLAGKRIPVIMFDVWKHEGDALRRTFLLEVAEQLNNVQPKSFFSKEITVDERLHSGRTVTGQRYVFRWKKLWKHLFFLPIFILIVLSILSVAKYWLHFKILSNVEMGDGIKLFTLIATASILFKYFDIFVDTEKLDSKQDRFQDPMEFETEFQRLLSMVKAKRILIVFDNIDRVSGESAVKIIAAIKTFLEPSMRTSDKELVFLVPCDVSAIKHHLAKMADKEIPVEEQEKYGEEFLRKFFNTVLWIPQFYQTDLEVFTRKKLDETKIPEFNNDEIAWLINKVFCHNIRQIIQFVNVLTINYVLLKKTSDKGQLPPDFYKNNLPQLAKYLLLLQRFPGLIEYFKTNALYDMEADDFHEATMKDLRGYLTWRRFMQETDQVKIESLEPFLTNKVSDDELRMPGITAWLLELETASFALDRVKVESFRLKEPAGAQVFNSVVISRLTNKMNAVSGSLFLNNILKVVQEMGIDLKSTLYMELANTLQGTQWGNRIVSIDPLNIEYLYSHLPYTNQSKKAGVNRAQFEAAQIIMEAKKMLAPEESRYLEKIFSFWSRQDDLSEQFFDDVRLKLMPSSFRFPLVLAIVCSKPSFAKQVIDVSFIIEFVRILIPADFTGRDELAIARMKVLASLPRVKLAFGPSQDVMIKMAQLLIGIQQLDIEDDRRILSYKNIALGITGMLENLERHKNAVELKGLISQLVIAIEKDVIAAVSMTSFSVGLHKYPFLVDSAKSIFKTIRGFIREENTLSVQIQQTLLQILAENPGFFEISDNESAITNVLESPKLFEYLNDAIPVNRKNAFIQQCILDQQFAIVSQYLEIDGDGLDRKEIFENIQPVLQESLNYHELDVLFRIVELTLGGLATPPQTYARLLRRKNQLGDAVYYLRLKNLFEKIHLAMPGIIRHYVGWLLQGGGEENSNAVSFLYAGYRKDIDADLLDQLVKRFPQWDFLSAPSPLPEPPKPPTTLTETYSPDGKNIVLKNDNPPNRFLGRQ